jgi:ankyrin repeat protein
VHLVKAQVCFLLCIFAIGCANKVRLSNACDVMKLLDGAHSDSAANAAVDAAITWVNRTNSSLWSCDGDPLLVRVASTDAIGVERLIAVMLARGANPNEVGADGRSALHLVSSIGDLDSVRALLSHHANPNLVSKNGYTALMDVAAAKSTYAALQEKRMSIARELIGAGADPGLRSVAGLTALDIAIANGNTAVQELLTGLNDRQ